MRANCVVLIGCAVTGDLKGHRFLGPFRDPSALLMRSPSRGARYCSLCVLPLISFACLKLTVSESLSAIVVQLVFNSDISVLPAILASHSQHLCLPTPSMCEVVGGMWRHKLFNTCSKSCIRPCSIALGKRGRRVVYVLKHVFLIIKASCSCNCRFVINHTLVRDCKSLARVANFVRLVSIVWQA